MLAALCLAHFSQGVDHTAQSFPGAFQQIIDDSFVFVGLLVVGCLQIVIIVVCCLFVIIVIVVVCWFVVCLLLSVVCEQTLSLLFVC